MLIFVTVLSSQTITSLSQTASPAAHFKWSVGLVFVSSAALPLQWSHLGWGDPSESLGRCHWWPRGGKSPKASTKWFCPTDAAVCLQQSSQGLGDTWGAAFLQRGPVERCFTIIRATMDSGLLRGAFEDEEEDSTQEHPSSNNANEEWGRKLLQEVHNFCNSCWWLYRIRETLRLEKTFKSIESNPLQICVFFPLVLITWLLNMLFQV